MSLAFLSPRASDLEGGGGQGTARWGGEAHRRSLSQGFAEGVRACTLPGIDGPGLADRAGFCGLPFAGSKGPGALLPPPEAGLLAASPTRRAPPGCHALFARSSAVIQNMLPHFPKRLSALARGGRPAEARGPGLAGADWLVGTGVAGEAGREGPDGEGCEDAESVLACGGKQHNLYKTELCRSWEETGTCRYGSKCQFAHGADELRDVPRHPKYKTEICSTFATTGTCPYGRRCRFIHQNGPFTGVGAKIPCKEPQKPALPTALEPRWPVRQQVTQEPMAPATRRLPVFVKLSTASSASLVMT